MPENVLCAYFKGLSKKNDECLLFTSFPLDEAVLTSILKNFKVHSQQRIVVFHDVLRHKNPGFLQCHYPNSLIVTMILKQNKQRNKKKCPIFHSKIWARIKSLHDVKKIQINELIVTSANLSAYHFVEAGQAGVVDSFCYWNKSQTSQLTIKKGLWPFYFKDIFSNKTERIDVRNIFPENILVNNTGSSLKIERMNETVADFFRYRKENIKLCAGPFINIKTIGRIWPNTTIEFRGEKNKKGQKLHAKIILTNKSIYMGSVNWTEQALGVLTNHETIVALNSGHKQLIKTANGFQKILLANDDTLADREPDDGLGDEGNWIQERNDKLRGPRDAKLEVLTDGKHVHIRLGKSESEIGKKIWIQPFKKPTEGMWLKVKAATAAPVKAKNPKKEDLMKKFAGILFQAPVTVSEKIYGKGWNLEMDYGEHWRALEHRDASWSVYNGNKTGQSRQKNRNKASTRDYDVREMRQLAIEDPERGKKVVPFLNWLEEQGIHQLHMPKWCGQFAAKISSIKRDSDL